MLEILVLILVVLWLTGNLHLNGFDIPRTSLFVFNGRPITLWDILIFIIILWATGLLPSPFREISGILIVLWLLSLFGIIAIAGLSNLIVLAIIIGIAVSIFRR